MCVLMLAFSSQCKVEACPNDGEAMAIRGESRDRIDPLVNTDVIMPSIVDPFVLISRAKITTSRPARGRAERCGQRASGGGPVVAVV